MANNTRKVGLKVELDGEKEYKQAISELNKGNQVLASELKKVQEEYKGNENSIEALNARGEVLQKQLQQQQDKVATLQKALQNAAEEYGEADKRTQEWQIQLNNAETAQIKLERAIEENNTAIANQGEATEDAGQKMTTLGDQVSGLAEKFGIHLPEGIRSALDNVDGFSSGTVAAMGVAAAGIGAVKLAIDGIKLGIEAVQQLNELTLEQASKADELLTRSAQTGLGVELLQQLDYAAKFIDFDGLDKALVKITDSMGKAAEGTEKQTEAFNALGVSIRDEVTGELRDNFDVFKDVIDALGDVSNETERDILANQLFGKSYAEMKPLIDAGTDALEERMQAANVASEEEIATLGALDDAHEEYQARLERMKQQIAVEFAPVSQAAMTKLGDLTDRAGQMFKDSGIVDSLGECVEPLGRLAEIGLDLLEDILPYLNGLVRGLASALEAVAKAAEWAGNKLHQFNEWAAEHTEITGNEDYGFGGAADYGYGNNAAGTDNWRGGLTWVGEGGPELMSLPRGTRIYSNQESRQMAAAATDTRTLETLLGRVLTALEQIRAENQAQNMRRRMA